MSLPDFWTIKSMSHYNPNPVSDQPGVGVLQHKTYCKCIHNWGVPKMVGFLLKMISTWGVLGVPPFKETPNSTQLKVFHIPTFIIHVYVSSMAYTPED